MDTDIAKSLGGHMTKFIKMKLDSGLSIVVRKRDIT